MANSSDQSVSPFFGSSEPAQATPEQFAAQAPPMPTEEEDSSGGEIAVDVHETDDAIVIVSPIAGVEPDQVEISADDDTVTISGERKTEHIRNAKNTSVQEIYWGAFSRTVELPVPGEVDKAQATFKHGVLTVRVPKSGKAKKRTIKVKSVE